MSAKGKVETLLGLIDLEGDFQCNGQRWLKADQPTIAARLGFSPRTLRNVIKDPAFDTHRTRLGGKNVTLIRRADPKSANGQLGKSKSARTASKSAKLDATSEQLADPKSAHGQTGKSKSASKSARTDATLEHETRREELRQIWLAHQCKFTTDRVTKSEYGLLLELAKLGTTPAEFRYVLNNWMEFLACVNATCTDDGCTSALKAYRPIPWLGTMVEFHEAVKEVYRTHQQWEATQAQKSNIDKLADEL